MKVAIVGSRTNQIDNLESFLPNDVTAIISGGAKGVDACAKEFARARGIPLVEFLPDYPRFGRRAPLLRNLEIIGHADLVMAFWDGKSRGTKFVIDQCIAKKIPLFAIVIP